MCRVSYRNSIPGASEGKMLGVFSSSWWRHQMETFSSLLTLCAGNSPVTGEFPSQRPVTRSFDVFFDPRLNKRLSKQSWGWWFEKPFRSLWRHYNVSYLLLVCGMQYHVISNKIMMKPRCSTSHTTCKRSGTFSSRPESGLTYWPLGKVRVTCKV